MDDRQTERERQETANRQKKGDVVGIVVNAVIELGQRHS